MSLLLQRRSAGSLAVSKDPGVAVRPSAAPAAAAGGGGGNDDAEAAADDDKNDEEERRQERRRRRWRHRIRVRGRRHRKPENSVQVSAGDAGDFKVEVC